MGCFMHSNSLFYCYNRILDFHETENTSSSCLLNKFTGANCDSYTDGNVLLRQDKCLKSNFNVTAICTGQQKRIVTIVSTKTLTQSTLQVALQKMLPSQCQTSHQLAFLP